MLPAIRWSLSACILAAIWRFCLGCLLVCHLSPRLPLLPPLLSAMPCPPPGFPFTLYLSSFPSSGISLPPLVLLLSPPCLLLSLLSVTFLPPSLRWLLGSPSCLTQSLSCCRLSSLSLFLLSLSFFMLSLLPCLSSPMVSFGLSPPIFLLLLSLLFLLLILSLLWFASFWFPQGLSVISWVGR